jgi:Protein of unknown function (DUF3887)
MNKFIATLLIPAALLGSVIPAYAQAPITAQPMQIAAQSSDVSAIAQNFISLLGQEDFSSAVSSYSSGSGVSPASLQQTWQDTVAVNGAFQQQVSTEVVDGGDGAQVVVVTCQFEQGTRAVVINFVNGQIVDFSVSES